MTLLVIIDPPGMVPIFLALTGALPARDRHRAAWQAVALALGVIVVFAVAGQTLLDYLHVDLPALQGAGGLLLVLVALELLTGKTDDPSQQVDLQHRAGAARHAAAGRPRRDRGDHAVRAAGRRAGATTWPSGCGDRRGDGRGLAGAALLRRASSRCCGPAASRC